MLKFQNKGRSDDKLTFTNNWFSRNINVSMIHLKNYVKSCENVDILEIGSHEGQSTVWMLQNLCYNPLSTFTSIDPYLTTDKTSPVDTNTINLFRNNIEFSGHATQHTLYQDLSKNILPTLKQKFDIIYIDGSHLEDDVRKDLHMSHELLKQNGLILMDDVGFEFTSEIARVLEEFLQQHDGEYNFILKEYQCLIQRC